MLEEAGRRLREAEGLAGILAASLVAFECIRVAARQCEDRLPELLPTFMAAASAATEGREAVTAAPSLAMTPAGSVLPDGEAAGDLNAVADAMGTLGMLLSLRLSEHAMTADEADMAACLDASEAGARIAALMDRGAGDRRPR